MLLPFARGFMVQSIPSVPTSPAFVEHFSAIFFFEKLKMPYVIAGRIVQKTTVRLKKVCKYPTPGKHQIAFSSK